MTSRDARQEKSRVSWIKNKCKGTIEACTGYGKTRVALNCIKSLLNKYPEKKILIVVPTTVLKEQWNVLLSERGLVFNCEVQIINTVIRSEWNCDLLIIDEIHRTASEQFVQIFKCVHYSLILGLTATIERLDGRHVLIKKYCPICDTITLLEAQLNGWISKYTEYQVILDVDDIDIYKKYNKSFNESFDFFDYDFNKAMKMVGPDGYKWRLAMREQICPYGTEEQRKQVLKNITYHAMNFMRSIQQRKTFINNHPKKIEIARRIIEARPNSKIITFSNNIKMAEAIGIGYVYTGKDSKKKGRITFNEFINMPSGILNTSKKCDEGIDIPNLSVAIMLGIDSSKIKATQRVGRVVRTDSNPNKRAEIFNLIINDTVELNWYKKAHPDGNYVTIDEEGLNDVLAGKVPKPYIKKLKDFQFRY